WEREDARRAAGDRIHAPHAVRREGEEGAVRGDRETDVAGERGDEIRVEQAAVPRVEGRDPVERLAPEATVLGARDFAHAERAAGLVDARERLRLDVDEAELESARPPRVGHVEDRRASHVGTARMRAAGVIVLSMDARPAGAARVDRAGD